MPVIPSLFGGSCRDDLISFSSLNTWDALDGLFPASRRAPVKEMRMPPPYSYGSRIRCDETAGRHTWKSYLRGLGIDDVEPLKVEEAVVALRARRVQRGPRAEKQRPSRGGETSPGRRIPLPDDAEVEEQIRAAIRKGVLMITTPRKGMEKKDYDSSTDQSGAEQI